MTREQIEADIRALESVLSFITRQQNVEAVERSITRLRADLDAMPVGETVRVSIPVFVQHNGNWIAWEVDRSGVLGSPNADAEDAATEARAFIRNGHPQYGNGYVVVADIPVRQVPVVKGVVR